jgi:hypothetical protein
MFRASRRMSVLDHFGVPYVSSDQPVVVGLEHLRLSNGARTAFLWPSGSDSQDSARAATVQWSDRSEIPVFARFTPDSTAQDLLSRYGGRWIPTASVAAGGRRIASIWRRDDGSVFVPFDPDEVRLNYLSERYAEIARRPSSPDWPRITRASYYRTRRLLPRAAQIWLRRQYARVQARTTFPAWPVETALHDFLDLVFTLVASIADEPVPRIAAWPDGKTWALVLTHDVETAAGLRGINVVSDMERELEARSSWNLTARRYDVDLELVRSLAASGFEVGVHGLYHDGRDLASLSMLRQRLSGMRAAAALWNAVGFRSPATQRAWALMPLLEFDYDSSYPDTDPFEPRSGGCCTWLPFFNKDMVELPMTLPQDHTLFVILRHPDERMWVDKARFLRDQGGMALLDTHPDYLIQDKIMQSYRHFLEEFHHDDTAWKALPAEVSAWWRRRAESRLERTAEGWVVTGPAAGEARVEFVAPSMDSFSRASGSNGTATRLVLLRSGANCAGPPSARAAASLRDGEATPSASRQDRDAMGH